MYVERELKKRFTQFKELTPAIAVVGARQTGKTTFLKAHTPKNAKYLLFDDPFILELFERDIHEFALRHPEELLILDEVHYAKDAGRKLKFLIDTGRKIWITASSEVLLDQELAFLVGRVTRFTLYPFSLREFLKAKKAEDASGAELTHLIKEHREYGGYPRIVLEKDYEGKKLLAKDIAETMILKDITQHFAIRNIAALQRLVKQLALISGNCIAYDTLAAATNTSFETIKEYLAALETTNMIRLVTPFFTNKQKELVKQPKIYFLDTGIRNAFLNQVEDDGALFENYIYTELVKLGFEVKYCIGATH